MSILIKGMEMPTSCYDCSFSVEAYEGAGVYSCVVTDNCVCKGAGRHDDCPLVPVPPHGRLGDLDALMRHCVMLPRDGGSLPVVYASYVRNAPTIIPAEPPKDDSPAGTYDLLYEEGGPDA